MNVLVACEFSAVIREAFKARGHNSWSCDLLPTEIPGKHFQKDIMEVLNQTGGWDIIIACPDCTAMCLAGNRHYGVGKPKHEERKKAISWTKRFWELAKRKAAKGVCFENPASVMFKHLAAAKIQYIQPYKFGHMEQKKTGLALYGLSPLEETCDVYVEMMRLPKCKRERIFYMSPNKNRGMDRSRFFKGIAEAMAEQWG